MIKNIPDKYLSYEGIDESVDNGDYDNLVGLSPGELARTRIIIDGIISSMSRKKESLHSLFPLTLRNKRLLVQCKDDRWYPLEVKHVVHLLDENGKRVTQSWNPPLFCVICVHISGMPDDEYLICRLTARGTLINNSPSVVALYKRAHKPVSPLKLITAMCVLSNASNLNITNKNDQNIILTELSEYMFTDQHGYDVIMTMYIGTDHILVARISTLRAGSGISIHYNVLSASGHTAINMSGSKVVTSNVATIIESLLPDQESDVMTYLQRAIKNNIEVCVDSGSAQVSLELLRAGTRGDGCNIRTLSRWCDGVGVTKITQREIDEYNNKVAKPQEEIRRRFEAAGYSKPNEISAIIINGRIVEQ